MCNIHDFHVKLTTLLNEADASETKENVLRIEASWIYPFQRTAPSVKRNKYQQVGQFTIGNRIEIGYISVASIKNFVFKIPIVAKKTS